MAWRAITEADVAEGLSGPEISAVRAAALHTGQTDSLPDTIHKVVQECRGFIAACRNNTLEAGDTVPEKLIDSCVAVIRFRFFNRPGLMLTQDRRSAKEDAIDLWKAVARCAFVIEEPVAPDPEPLSSAQHPSFRGREAQFGRELSDGL
jgi:hypothetical protein